MDADKDVFLNKDETNDKRSWVKILIIVLLLLLIIGGIIFGINIVIKNINNKGYKDTIDKIQDAASTYVVEQSNGMLWLVNKNDKVYQCITVQNLIDKKYFDDSILNSEIGDDRKVLNSDYIYIEKDQTTKKIMKKILLYNTESEYVKSCGILSNVDGDIDINVPSEYSKSKEVVITYNLKADIGNASNYKYSYRFDAQNDKEDISDKEFNFDDKNQIISKVIVNDNGWIYAKIEKSDGTVISNVSMEINSIDRKEPIIYADDKLNTSVRGNIVIPFTISDTGSGIKNEDIKLSDFKVYIGDNLLTSNYTFEKVKDSSNTFNYNLKIENFNYYGEVKIIVDKDKIKDNLGIGNESTTINTGVTFNNKYVISYKSNGGSGTLEDTICTYDVSCKLNKNTFNKIGYTFLGWAITSEGDVVYNDNHLFKTFNSKNDINLFAVWEANPYLIKYDANGGTGSMIDSSCIYDNNCTLRNNTFVRTGYTFDGWNTKKDGSGTNYTNAQEVKNLVSTSNGSIVLYAKWNANQLMFNDQSYTITYSESDSQVVFNGADFGTGNYIYTLSGEATSYFSLSGTTFKIKSSTPVNAYNLNVMAKDQDSGVTKTAKIVINIIKAATATIGKCNSLVYNGSSQVLASGGKYITYSDNSGIDAGTYSNIIMQTDSNHTFSDGSVKKILSCDIDKKQVSVSWGNTTFTYNGSSQGPTASVNTGVSSETMTVVRTTQVNANDNNYTSSASCSSVSGGRTKCDNYSLVNNTKEYKINQADGNIKLSASNESIIFGTSTKSFTVASHHGGTLSVSDDNSTAGVSLSGSTVSISNLSSINAGTVITVTVTSGATQNYKAASATYKLTVNPSATATVGNCLNPTYTGSAVTLAGNGANVQYTNNSGTNVSSYTVTATVVNSNYTFSDGSTSKTLTCGINQANGYVNLASTSGTINYGTSQATFTVSKHHGGTLSVSDDNSTASVSVSGSTVTISNLSSISASTFITVTVTSGVTQNYKVASATYKLTVNPSATATVGNCLNPTYTGRAVTLAGNGANVNYTNNSGIDVSSYTVTATVVNSNYTFSDGSTSKTLTCGINQANGFVNLASTSGSVKYGTSQATFLLSSNHGGTLSVSDNNSTATVSLSGNTVTISNLSSINAGTSIVVTVTVGAVQNYKAASSNYTLTIAKNDSNPTSVVAKGGVYSGTALQLVTTSNAQGTVYYCTSTSLTSSNYNTSGSTTIPTGTCNSASGNTYTVYWYTPGNTNYVASSGSVNSTVTCKTYTISYDLCSGSNGPSAQTKYYGVTLKLSSTTPTRSGYTFKGWATSSAGGCSATSSSYSAGGNYSVSTEGNATLYAVWMNNNNKCTVGSTFENCLLTENRDSNLWTVSLTDYTPSPSEYRFVGTKSSPPSNYICFGTSNSSTCTSNSGTYMYRIIGVFTEGDTKYLKLIKNTKMSGTPAIDDNFNSDNRWSATTLYSSINGSEFLNNTTYIPNSTWKNKIVSRTWVSTDTNLNGYNSSGIRLYTLTPSKIYCLEYNISSCKPSGAIYTNSTAKIGLMYTSDFNLSLGSSAAKTSSSVQNYASTLKTGWMYNYTNFSNSASGMIEWSMTRAGYPVSGLTNARFYGVYVSGYPFDAENRYGAEYRPVFYIKASEKYGGGLGTAAKPFIISE